MSVSRFFIITAVTTLASCRSYSPAPDYVFHSTYDKTTLPHADKGCVACHVGAAAQQGLSPESDDGWVTLLGSACSDCHPFTSNLPSDFACPDDPLEAGYDSEKCRFERSHPEGDGRREQDCAICHPPAEHATWGEARSSQGGDDHEHGDLLNTFPLIGPHDDLPCSSCHSGTYSDQRGDAKLCGNCHTREGSGAPFGAGHNPPGRQGWTDETERDCITCHVAYNTDGSHNWPPVWSEIGPARSPNVHQFLVPHRTVEDWSVVPPVPTPFSQWKSECWSCHNQDPNPTDNDTDSQRVGPVSVSLLFDPAYVSCTNGCHTPLPTGHITPNAGQSCMDSHCHTTGGPFDIANYNP